MKKLLSVLLVLAICLSLCTAVFASGEPSEDTAAAGAASGEAPAGGGGGGGGGSGGMGGVTNLAGMLSLASYVAENTGGNTVSFDVYGILRAGGESDSSAFVIDKDADVNVLNYMVYADRAMTEPAAGVTASVSGNVLTVSGVAADVNTAYYIGADYAAEAVSPTAIYIVNDQYDASVDYALNDGTIITLSGYAPGVASESRSKIYIGCNTTLFSAADYGITDPADAAIADWWLGSGITNAGSTLSDFGDTFYRFELSVDLYRQFQIVIDNDTSVAPIGGTFAEPADVIGAMGSNDQFSDSIAATLYSGVWDGIYTTKNADGYLENIPGVTEFQGKLPVDEEFLFVALYNAFVSPWASLNADGQALAAGLNAQTSAEKISQIKAALGLEDWAVENYSTQKLAVLDVLRTADAYIAKKAAPGAELQAAAQAAGYTIVDNATADIASLLEPLAGRVIDGDTEIIGEDLTTSYPSALFIKGGHVKITDTTIVYSGSNSEPGKTGASATDMLSVQGNMPASSDIGYNMTMANAYYRYGFGAGVIAWGEDTLVEIGTTTGELVISGPSNGSMAGGLYNAFGASYLIEGAIAYSAGQHLSNTVYNGTIHYRNAAALGGGRMYSSDFWGGNVVFENTIGTGGNVTDEPTALIVKNTLYKGAVNLNGYATAYFENAYIEGGSFSSQNNTSLVSDAANFTLVNTRLDGTSFLSVGRSSRAVVKLVDSQVNLTGDTLAKLTNGNYGPGNLGEGFTDMFQTEARIYIYGTCGFNSESGTLTVNVDTDQTLTLYVGQIIGGAIENVGAGNFEIVYDDEYGTLYVNTDYALPSHSAAAPSGETPSGETPSAEATDDASGYPHFAEYQDYVGALVEADDFMMGQGAYEDTFAADNPYGIPFVDINEPIGAMDYPDWMAANYPGETFPTE